jgi:hypothetical protein
MGPIKYFYLKICRVALLVPFGFMTLYLTPAAAESDTARLTKTELNQLLQDTENIGNLERLSEHYRSEAARLEGKAAEHERLADKYRKNPTWAEQKQPMTRGTVGYHRHFAQKSRHDAMDAREKANEFDGQLAKRRGTAETVDVE